MRVVRSVVVIDRDESREMTNERSTIGNIGEIEGLILNDLINRLNQRVGVVNVLPGDEPAERNTTIGDVFGPTVCHDGRLTGSIVGDEPMIGVSYRSDMCSSADTMVDGPGENPSRVIIDDQVDEALHTVESGEDR